MSLEFKTYKGNEQELEPAIAGFHVASLQMGTMLPVTHEKVARALHSVFGLLDGVPIATASVTVRESGVATVGAYLTHEEFQGMGYGFQTLQRLTATALDEVQDLKPSDVFEANVNDFGLSQFSRLGFLEVALRQPLSATGCDHVMRRNVSLAYMPDDINPHLEAAVL